MAPSEFIRLSVSKQFYLQCTRSLLLFGDTILVDSCSEGRPGRGVLILRCAGEQLIATLYTNIDTYTRE